MGSGEEPTGVVRGSNDPGEPSSSADGAGAGWAGLPRSRDGLEDSRRGRVSLGMGIESPHSVGRAEGGRLVIGSPDGEGTAQGLKLPRERDSDSRIGTDRIKKRQSISLRKSGWPRVRRGCPGLGRPSMATATGDHLVPECLGGRLEFFDRAVVGEDMVGLSAFLFERPLDLLAGGEDFGRPPSRGFEPGQADLGRGVDEDHEIAKRVPARLVEDRRVENDRVVPAPAGFARDRLLEGLPHGRMEDRFQVAERLGPGKDDRTQGPTVDRPADPELPERLENLLAESFEDPVSTGALLQENMADLVGVEQQTALAREDRGHLALAGTDAADHPDDGNRAVPPGAGGSATGTGVVEGGAGHDGSIHAQGSGGTGRIVGARHGGRVDAGGVFGRSKCRRGACSRGGDGSAAGLAREDVGDL